MYTGFCCWRWLHKKMNITVLQHLPCSVWMMMNINVFKSMAVLWVFSKYFEVIKTLLLMTHWGKHIKTETLTGYRLGVCHAWCYFKRSVELRGTRSKWELQNDIFLTTVWFDSTPITFRLLVWHVIHNKLERAILNKILHRDITSVDIKSVVFNYV